MEAELIEKQAVNATFKVTVPATEVDAAFDRVLGSLSRSMRVPGFRPGHAPRGVLERRIGRETLEEEVREALVDESYPEAVRELELMPVHAHFHSDPPKEGEAFTFEVHAELYPEVELPDVSSIVIDAAPREVTDAMVEDAIEQLRDQHATLVPVDRTIEATDYLLLETVPKEGEPASEGAGAVQPVDMEAASDEVKAQLTGKGIGEIIDLTLTDIGASEAREEGAEPPKRTLRVLIKDVKAKDKPSPDDDFAKTLGVDTWADARERIVASLTSQVEREAFDQQRDELVDKLLAASAFEVPSSLVDRRKRSLLQDLADDLAQQGTTFERYLADLEERGGRQEFDSELQESALRSVRRDLVLERLQEQRGTDVTDEEFDEAVRYLARRRRQEPSRFKREMGERWLSNYRFLLARDKALRDTVRELVGSPEPEPDQEAAEAVYEAAAEGAGENEEDEAEAGGAEAASGSATDSEEAGPERP